MTEFYRFWQAYPRKVAKTAARREFDKAILKTDIESILNGVEAYKRNKPDYQDWAHARTWLYNERWTDEWESEQAMSQEQIEYWRQKLSEGGVVPDSIRAIIEPKLRLVR